MKIPFIKTYTGKLFPLTQPTPDHICIEDIAHGLSLTCRYSGQCKWFYSVAQHSVLVARKIEELGEDKKMLLQGLLHDAAEAYIGDMTAPLKYWLNSQENHEFRLIENGIMDAIAKKFDIQARKPEKVGEVDLRMFATEARDIMTGGMDYGDMDHIGESEWPKPYDDIEFIDPWPPELAKVAFLEMFEELTNGDKS